MKKICVYISGKSNRLLKYLKFKKKEYLGINLVFSDLPIEELLQEELDLRGIDNCSVDYNCMGENTLEKRINFSNYFLHELEIHQIDYCISFGEHILTGNILKEYKNKIINFHPSILPMFKGVNAIDQALYDRNIMLVGNTAHFIDEGVDTGMIIMQSVIPIKAFYDKGNDYDVVLDLQIDMLDKIIELLNEDRIVVVEDKVEIIGANYSTHHVYPDIE